MGTISGMQLNGYYAAVLSEGRIQLHMVRLSPNGHQRQEKVEVTSAIDILMDG